MRYDICIHLLDNKYSLVHSHVEICICHLKACILKALQIVVYEETVFFMGYNLVGFVFVKPILWGSDEFW